jgi:hypothetical protein
MPEEAAEMEGRGGQKGLQSKQVSIKSFYAFRKVSSYLTPHSKSGHCECILPFENLGQAYQSGITTVKFRHQESPHKFDYCGAVIAGRIVEAAAEFLVQNSDGTSPEAKRILNDFIQITSVNYLHLKELQGVTQPPNTLGVFLSLRLENGNAFSTMKWHTERRMYVSSNDEVNSVYCMTILGNPTRIVPETQVVKDLRDKEHLRSGNSIRSEVCEILDEQPLLPAKCGDILRFTWGQPDSPLHAGGKNDTDRIIVLAVYGTPEEIKGGFKRAPYCD